MKKKFTAYELSPEAKAVEIQKMQAAAFVQGIEFQYRLQQATNDLVLKVQKALRGPADHPEE